MNKNIPNCFNAALVKNGIIANILVFEDEETMQEFGAVRLSDGQGIGDLYLSPEDYEKKKKQDQLLRTVASVINAV